MASGSFWSDGASTALPCRASSPMGPASGPLWSVACECFPCVSGDTSNVPCTSLPKTLEKDNRKHLGQAGRTWPKTSLLATNVK